MREQIAHILSRYFLIYSNTLHHLLFLKSIAEPVTLLCYKATTQEIIWTYKFMGKHKQIKDVAHSSNTFTVIGKVT